MTCIWKFFIKLCLHIMVFIKFLPFIIVRLLVYWLRKDQLNFQNYIHNTTTTTCSFGNNNSDPEMYSFCFWFKREKKWCDMVFTAKTDMEYELDFLQSILVFLCVCVLYIIIFNDFSQLHLALLLFEMWAHSSGGGRIWKKFISIDFYGWPFEVVLCPLPIAHAWIYMNVGVLCMVKWLFFCFNKFGTWFKWKQWTNFVHCYTVQCCHIKTLVVHVLYIFIFRAKHFTQKWHETDGRCFFLFFIPLLLFLPLLTNGHLNMVINIYYISSNCPFAPVNISFTHSNNMCKWTHWCNKIIFIRYIV